jgi:Na+-driven multidrug efflux pump
MEENRFNKSVLDTDRIGHLLIKLSMPVFFGMFVQSLYNVISAIFIGRYVGHLGMAALFWTHLFRLKGVWLAFPSSDVLTFFLVGILMLPILRNSERVSHIMKYHIPDIKLLPEGIDQVLLFLKV